MEAFAPLQVRVQDDTGRVWPLTSDRLTALLLWASQRAGHADAFLARELAESVLHFLRVEYGAEEITLEQLRSSVGKVVRELGHARLAASLATVPLSLLTGAGSPTLPSSVTLRLPTQGVSWPAVRGELYRRAEEAWALASIYAPDVAWAVEQGIVRLGGLGSPVEPYAWVVDARETELWQHGGAGLMQHIGVLGRQVAGALILDACEHMFAQAGMRMAEIAPLLQQLWTLADGLGRRIVVHVGGPEPRPDALHKPTLFSSAPADEPGRIEAYREAILDEFFHTWQRMHAGTPSSQRPGLCLDAPGRLELCWHIGRRDVGMPSAKQRLVRLTHRALQGAPIHCALDRPRMPVFLDAALYRGEFLLLGWVGLDLARAAELGVTEGKWPDLLRLLAAAAAQKVRYLKESSSWSRLPMHLERTHLAIHLVGDATGVLSGRPEWQRWLEAVNRSAPVPLRVAYYPGSEPVYVLPAATELPALVRRHIAGGATAARLELLPPWATDPETWSDLFRTLCDATALEQVRFATRRPEQKLLELA